MKKSLEENDLARETFNFEGRKAFRATAFSFRKTKKQQTFPTNFLPTFHSQKIKDESKKLIITNSPEKNSDLACSRFAQSYIQKLKKERKRQTKKHQNFRSKKIENESMRLKKKDKRLLNEDSSNKIILLDKVNSGSQNKFMNTISIVSKDLYEVNIYNEEKQRKTFTPVESPSWAKKERINEIINEVRKSNSKELPVDHILEGKEFIKRDYAKKFLIEKNKGKKMPKQLKQEKKEFHRKREDLNAFKTLDPWKDEKNFHDYSIEEYGSN